MTTAIGISRATMRNIRQNLALAFGAVIGPTDIGGVHIKYLYHCRRQLWLYGVLVRTDPRTALRRSVC